jgi:hypothetical protein
MLGVTRELVSSSATCDAIEPQLGLVLAVTPPQLWTFEASAHFAAPSRTTPSGSSDSGMLDH